MNVVSKFCPFVGLIDEVLSKNRNGKLDTATGNLFQWQNLTKKIIQQGVSPFHVALRALRVTLKKPHKFFKLKPGETVCGNTELFVYRQSQQCTLAVHI